MYAKWCVRQMLRGTLGYFAENNKNKLISDRIHRNNEAIEKLYQCPECGLHYGKKEKAEECEAWCREHHSCNLEITSQAIES
ncbi:hypothetical protein A2Z53_02395 [Candidatus Giovannonibacteria bacterium RIFCSPHIGHO2_02_42_15]|nr:MAG: hypothetical protein A2Z53_02395 [Candidatus Giovannonibacteria bacterium RIFCSPHIGHO2_02_42_15]